MPNTRVRSRGSHSKSSTSRLIPTRRGSSSIFGRGREITNEWSPRGRGNNSSSGNGRDIPDECSPIGRGSNNTSGNGRGRADDCSPRGRGSNNTSGNSRGIADDISPRGRGSNNRDILDDCSPIGRANSSIDNEEHVVHVVGSSQNQVGSNVTPSSSLPKLWLVGEVFYDPAISRHVTFYRWKDAESNQIRDTWESHMKNTYSDIIRGVRKAAMKVTRVNDKVDIGRIKKNKENERNTEIDENGSKSLPDDFEVWKDVDTSNRGHVLGARFMTDPAFVLTGTMRSASIYATRTCSPYEEIRILKKKNDDLKKKMKDADPGAS
uniref:Uncharacterized protein n=1 Tax=Tanacetum cinerariifolium TaxID=118510 RepID=A0A699HAL8_TANCI|nr:hypothetical protein [Tanacetum cinerariifolium]